MIGPRSAEKITVLIFTAIGVIIADKLDDNQGDNVLNALGDCGLVSVTNIAIQAGIDAARGEYLSFVDADDWVETGFLQAFVDKMVPSKMDMVMQGYVNHQGEILNMPDDYYVQKDQFGAPLAEAKDRMLLSSACNKMYSSAIVKGKGILFKTDVPVGEDFLFNLAFLSYMNSFAISSLAFYYYRNTGAKSYSTDCKGLMNRLSSFDTIFRKIDFFSDSERQLFISKEFQMSIYAIRVVYHEKKPRQERLTLLRETRQRGKGNQEVHLATYPLSARLIAWSVLYCPVTVTDFILSTIRKFRK